jgi:diguanylate cyclase (GGDEF)-like protein
MTNALEKVINARKIEILYRHGTIAVAGMLFLSVAAAAFAYYFIWPEERPADILLVWLVMFFLVSLLRLYGFTLYKINKKNYEYSGYWLYAFICGIILSGSLWGIFFLYLVGFIETEHTNFVLFFMVGLVSAAVATYATSLLAFLVTALTVVGPVVIYFVLQTDSLTNYMGYMLMIYLLYLTIIARRLNKTLEEFLAHEFNVSRLEREKQYAAMLNRELEEEILKRIDTEGKLKEEISKAEALADKLVMISSKDGLTGINNRRRFDEYLENEWNRSARSKSPLSLILCDIDFYKAYNDTYGHLAGDDTLKKVASILEHYARRAGDMAARYGGEEFVILLPDTDAEKAVHIAEQIRASVEDLRVLHKSSQIHDYLTVSIGVATIVPAREQNPSTLINLADEALYRAKHNGRNRVMFHGG